MNKLIQIPNSDIKFTGDEDILEVYNDIEFKCFLIRRDDDDFDVADKDMNVFATMTIEDLMPIGDFERLVICNECKGTGEMLIGPSCSSPASICCGGCYIPTECECEGVLFEV